MKQEVELCDSCKKEIAKAECRFCGCSLCKGCAQWKAFGIGEEEYSHYYGDNRTYFKHDNFCSWVCYEKTQNKCGLVWTDNMFGLGEGIKGWVKAPLEKGRWLHWRKGLREER